MIAPDTQPWADLRSRYLTAQLQGDRRTALRVVLESLEGGAPAPEIQRHVISAAQREIGRLWQENAIGVAEEHMATAISQVALAHVYDHAERSRTNGKRVLVACVEGELHEFPARLVADALDLAGFDVKYLGANVPTVSLLRMANAERPDLIALSVTMSFNLPAARDAVDRLRAETCALVPIAVGGGALSSSGDGSACAADLHGDQAEDVVAAVRQCLGVGV